MRCMKQFFRFIVVCVVLAALCIPSQQALAKDTVIRFVNWASSEAVTRETLDNVIKEFEAQNPGITDENLNDRYLHRLDYRLHDLWPAF